MWELSAVIRRLRIHAEVAESRARMAERKGFTRHAEAWKASAQAMRDEIKRLESSSELNGTETTTRSEMGPVGKALSGAASFGLLGAVIGAVAPGVTAGQGAKAGAGLGVVLGLLGLGSGSTTRTTRTTLARYPRS